MTEPRKFEKIGRMFREVVITEKIDGQNVAIHIEEVMSPIPATPRGLSVQAEPGDILDWEGDRVLRVSAQSRTRMITPADDMDGFAAWVATNAAALTHVLGKGVHFGEWWGWKIKRGYNLARGERRLSLFNVSKWAHLDGTQIPGLYCVPIVDHGDLADDLLLIPLAANALLDGGSLAAPGFDRPEGIVIYWPGSDTLMKYSFDGDGHKGRPQDEFTGLPGLVASYRED